MRKSILKVMIVTLAAGSLSASPLLAQDKNRAWNFDRDRVEKKGDNNGRRAVSDLEAQAGEVNRAAKRADNSLDIALHTVSIETGVPKDRVKAMHDKYPDIGPAGVMMANVLAAETKKDPEDFMKAHHNGKTWTAIARDNNVPADKLNVRLNRLESALESADTVPAKKQKHRD